MRYEVVVQDLMDDENPLLNRDDIEIELYQRCLLKPSSPIKHKGESEEESMCEMDNSSDI